MAEGVWSHAFENCRMMEVEWQHMFWEHDVVCDGKWT